MNFQDGFNFTRSNTNYFTNVIVRSSFVYSNREDGLQITGGVIYTNNLLDGTGNVDGLHGDGIQGAGGRIVVAGNTFRNWPQSIFIESGGEDTYMGGLRIFNNEFYREAHYTTYMLAVSLKAKFTTIPSQTVFMEDLLVANNTVWNTYDRHGVRIQYAPTPTNGTFIITNSRIVNNIFIDIDSASHPVAIDDAVIATDASITIQTNNVFGNETFNWDGIDYATIAAMVAARPTFTGNTNAAPVFVDTNAYNLRIDSSDVYVKNKGIPVSEVAVDILGNARSASAPTIGAFEFVDAFVPTIVTNNASGARVSGFRNLAMAVLPPLEPHNHPASPLLFENFEGSGYALAGWSEYLDGTGVVLNEDNTTNVLSGSQSFAIAPVGIPDGPHFSTNSFTASSAVYGYFQFKCLKYPNETEDRFRQIIALHTASGTAVFRIKQADTGSIYVETGGTADVALMGALTIGQTYHIWWSWNKDNGSNSAATIGISTDKNKPTSGDGFVSITGTQIATDASVIMLGYSNDTEEGASFYGSPSWIYDYVLLDDESIQSYP